METFSFKPDPADARRHAERVAAAKVWWVEFSPLVERIFASAADVAAVIRADYGVAWTDIETHHRPRVLPTDRDGVWCVEFAAPIERMAVEEADMGEWMQLVRANGCRGRYRLAGTDRWYEF